MPRIHWGWFALATFGCANQPADISSPDDGSAPTNYDAPAEAAAAEAEVDGSACDRQLPACPKTPPSYQTDVAPIIARECSACHYAGSTIARGVYSTYAELEEGRGSVLDEVYACKMPTAPVAPLTPIDRTTLLAWIECGGPNN